MHLRLRTIWSKYFRWGSFILKYADRGEGVLTFPGSKYFMTDQNTKLHVTHVSAIYGKAGGSEPWEPRILQKWTSGWILCEACWNAICGPRGFEALLLEVTSPLRDADVRWRNGDVIKQLKVDRNPCMDYYKYIHVTCRKSKLEEGPDWTEMLTMQECFVSN